MPPGKSFHDVRGHGESGTAKLCREFKSFEIREALARKLMEPNEEVVCALPGNQRVMSQVHNLSGYQMECLL